METSREALQECKHLERVQGLWKEVQWRQREEQMSRIREQVIPRTKSNSGRGPDSGPVSLGKTWGREDAKELFTIGHERPDQRKTSTERKGVLWLRERLIRKVRHPEWITNAIPIKLANGTWKVQVDYFSLNKVCAKDMYPFPKEGKELASLMGYPYKCFLRLPKEYNQIRIAENDEEKTGFQTGEGVYCFTHMPKELKKISSYTSEDDGEDVEEILRKLKRVNIKIDPVTSSFGVKEGRFLGYMVTKEGVKEDLEKIQAIILGPTPRSSNQIRSLFLKLTAISKFIPKLAELKYPIREARMRLETAKGSGWTNEAEEALRRIKEN
ncbi:hypothetical protein Tco_1482295 [Tanacetum coccineum]